VHRLRLLLLRLPVRSATVSSRRQFWLPQEETGSIEEFKKYGANRLAQGKLPLCAEMCSTKSLLAGDGDIIAQIYKERVLKRGYGSGAWGWLTAYHEEIPV
jgi:formate dehydrogenase iron-sulfur subunit